MVLLFVGYFSVFAADKDLVPIDGTKVGRVVVRKKGFAGSLDPERPLIKVQIDKFEKGRRFAGVDTLTLNNNKQDPSRVH